jgi:hypothetical protein
MFFTAMYASPTRHHVSLRAKGLALSMVLWLFGISTSMLLIGLWGRSVAADRVTLESSTRAVLESEIVNERVTDWLGDAVSAAAEVSPDDVADVVESVAGSPEMQVAIDEVVDQTVAAALAPPGADTEIDLSEAVDALAPAVAAALEERGVVADADAVRAAAQSVPGIVLSADDPITVGGAARQVKGILTKVFIVGLGGMLLAGAAAVWLSSDRVRRLRALVIRVGVSAVTFAIVIRIGAWAVDPAGGRSPVAAGGAVLLKSNGHVLTAVAVGAAAVAAGMSALFVRRRRPQPGAEGSFDTTGEQPVLVGSASR